MDRFIATHMICERIQPDAPISAPTTVRSWCRVQGLRVYNLGFRLYGSRFQVPRLGIMGYNSWIRI